MGQTGEGEAAGMKKVKMISQIENPILWPDPTPEEINTPEFMAIWNVIKTWDINVPGAYVGYCGATGNHVKAILDAVKRPKN